MRSWQRVKALYTAARRPLSDASVAGGTSCTSQSMAWLLLKQLTSREPEQFTDLARGGRTLKAAGVAHGDMVYLLYDFVRQVEPAYKKTPLEARPFGEQARQHSM
jgi:hypothetical protein